MVFIRAHIRLDRFCFAPGRGIRYTVRPLQTQNYKSIRIELLLLEKERRFMLLCRCTGVPCKKHRQMILAVTHEGIARSKM